MNFNDKLDIIKKNYIEVCEKLEAIELTSEVINNFILLAEQKYCGMTFSSFDSKELKEDELEKAKNEIDELSISRLKLIDIENILLKRKNDIESQINELITY